MTTKVTTRLPAWGRSFVDLLAVALGVALPLEVLPDLPALIHYASYPQIVEVFAELALVFLGLGMLFGVVCMIVGAVRAWLKRIPLQAGVSTALAFGRVIMLGLALLEGLRTWLHAIGLSTQMLNWLREASWVPQQIPEHRIGIWLGLGIVLSILAWKRQESMHAGHVIAAQQIRFWGVTACVTTFVGLSLKTWWPLMDNRTAVATRQASATQHPNLLLLTIDTLSAEHLSLYGYQRPTSPALDQFASTANVFDHFYSNSNVTTPSMSSILLGERPWRHRVFVAPAAPVESHSRRSLLTAFHDAGYRTIAVSTNPFASPPKMMLMPDVDSHDVAIAWSNLCPYDPDRITAHVLSPQSSAILNTNSLWQASRDFALRSLIKYGACPPTGHYDPAYPLGLAEQRWKASSGQPTLVWVHLTPPHDPYAAPAPYAGLFQPGPEARSIFDSSPVYHYLGHPLADRQRRELLGRYDESIRYVDTAIGDFLHRIDVQGLLKNTIVVISADHGENFSHDYGGHGGPELFDEVTHLPLIVRLPGQMKGKRIAVPAEQIDIYPTVAQLAGVPVVGHPEGQSLAGAMAGFPTPRPVFSMNFERSARNGRLEQGTVMMVDYPWKLQRRIGPIDPTTPSSQRDRLSSLDEDPHEQQDVSASHPEIVARMRAAIEREVEANRAIRP